MINDKFTKNVTEKHTHQGFRIEKKGDNLWYLTETVIGEAIPSIKSLRSPYTTLTFAKAAIDQFWTSQKEEKVSLLKTYGLGS